jgi:hypothetical protein
MKSNKIASFKNKIIIKKKKREKGGWWRRRIVLYTFRYPPEDEKEYQKRVESS